MVASSIRVDYRIQAMSWSLQRNAQHLRLAISSTSAEEDVGFEVGIIGVHPHQINQPVKYYLPLNLRRIANDLAFIFDPGLQYPDLFATASDKLRVWQINGHSIQFKREYPNIFPPYNSNIVTVENIQWNSDAPWRMAALCSEGSCVIWDLERGRPEAVTEPDAKDDFFIHEISWGGPRDLAAGYDDGRLQILDLRTRRPDEIYSAGGGHYIHRVEWNGLFPNYLALTMGRGKMVIVDRRWPQRAVVEMEPHDGKDVYAMVWDPTKGTHICTAGKDSGLAVHNIRSQRDPELIAAYATDTDAMMKLKWSFYQPEWLAYMCGNTLQLLDVEYGVDELDRL